jgi:hypothetical protein
VRPLYDAPTVTSTFLFVARDAVTDAGAASHFQQ